MSPEPFHELAGAVDRAIADAERLEPAAREVAATLRAALERFHKAGLAQIVVALKADPRGKELLFELVDVPEVRALLSLHGLIRMPAADDSSAPAPAPACATSASAPAAVLIPLASLKGRRSPDGQSAWTAGPPLAEVSDARPFRLDVGDTSVVLFRSGGDVRAFRNECAHQGLPIDGGRIDREAGTVTCPWHGFRFDCATGECLTAPHVQLEPVSARVEEGTVYVQLAR